MQKEKNGDLNWGKGEYEKHRDRLEVLEKVKSILMMPSTQFSTTKQVADLYRVPTQAIKSLVKENELELNEDACRIFNKKDVIILLNIPEETITYMRDKTIAKLPNGEELIIPNRGLRLFPRRAILRVGMLLRDSEVADEVCAQLLGIAQRV